MPQRLLEKLKPYVESMECENLIKHLDDQGKLSAWDNNPLMGVWLRHTAGQDIIAGIEDLAAGMFAARRPAAIGRMLVRRYNSTRENIKIRSPKIGKAVKTAKGKISVSSHGERQNFLTIEADTEIEVSDEWDLNYLENAEWNVMQAQTQEIGMTLAEYESQFIIDKLKTITTASSAGLVTLASNAALTPDMLITAWGNVLEQNGDVNTLIINPQQAVELFKNSEMKNQLILGEFANYSSGMLGMFMGMQIYMSTQVPKKQAFAFDKNRLLLAMWMRDRLITPYTPRVHVTGIQASCRLGVIFGDTKICSPIRAS